MAFSKARLIITGSAAATGVFINDRASEKVDSKIGRDGVGKTFHNENEKYKRCIRECRLLVQRFQVVIGAPGISIGVSVNGEVLWKEGFGYADIENMLPFNGDSVGRIASISKPITMTLVGKLVEQGKLDLDVPIQDYVKSFPPKEIKEKPARVTTRHLVSNLGGIRHYKMPKKGEKCASCGLTPRAPDEFESPECCNTKTYKSTADALELFVKDPLEAEPGSKFIYSTFGWTLVSAVVESAGGSTFPNQLRSLFRQLGMTNTHLDENIPILPNRVCYYRRSKKSGNLENVPPVDNSYKWAGGGLLSNVGDLLKFGNHLIYSYQCADFGGCKKSCVLTSETLKEAWRCAPNTERPNTLSKKNCYGMGWSVVPKNVEMTESPLSSHGYVYHTGGAAGASSILVVAPQDPENNGDCPPQGICVAILCNLQSCSLGRLAVDIADAFAKVTQ